MAAIINADDGVISGASGLKLSSDTSGALNIQTNGVTAIAISASQAVSFPATTSLNFTSANITTLTSSSATITNLLATTLTVSSVGIFPAGSASSAAITTAGDTNTGIFFPAADTIAFTEGGTEVLRLNSSAQVAVNTAGTAAAPVITKTDDLNTGIFFPAADTIAFAEGGVESARFDSSGNLGVGTTSPSTFGGGGLTLGSTSSGKNLILNSSNAGNNGLIQFLDTGGSNAFQLFATTSQITLYGYGSRPMTFVTNDTERARITSAGAMGIGTSNPQARLEVNTASGADAYALAAWPFLKWDNSNELSYGGYTASQWQVLKFFTAGSERARITSTGNFGVATSSPSYLVDIASNTGTAAHLRATGSFITRKYTFEPNLGASRTLRVTLSVAGLQFVNFFLDMMGHFYINGALWEARRFAFQFMCEGSILRLNQRMPNYEYGAATAGVFNVGNPPSWTYVGGNTYSFDFTVATGYPSYISVLVEGPGIENITITQIS